MTTYGTLINGVEIIDGTGAPSWIGDVAISGDCIVAVGQLDGYVAENIIRGDGLALSPGFIDVHTHDDLYVIRSPEMLPKLSQGVTTVIVGNCGISAGPVHPSHVYPDPMNLLGEPDQFQYPKFASYVEAVRANRPAVNVGALVGHTSLRQNHMDRLDRTATGDEIERMKVQLRESLENGALGLSTGLAYLSANSATTEEVMELTKVMNGLGIYATHMRTEANDVLKAMDEALTIGDSRFPVVISHLKCAGVENWGRSGELLSRLDAARLEQRVACDCYPYAAGSSTLDLRQVDERVNIMITWSSTHPEMGGKRLAQIANEWSTTQLEAAKRLQPAGAIYHCIDEGDMRKILSYPLTMIGSDGLPNDPLPHPRLWGTFPRVLGRYCRELKLFSLPEAIRKMTGLPAEQFRLAQRGRIEVGYKADLVLFNAKIVCDTATYENPKRPAAGIEKVWVNGVLSYENQASTNQRAGKFLERVQ